MAKLQKRLKIYCYKRTELRKIQYLCTKIQTMHPLEQFKYCPRCGTVGFGERDVKAKHCDACGFTYYFNPSAATVALIVNDRGELLVCRRAKEPAKGTLDLPGGFIDMGETGEEGVAREVKEETALEVTKTEFLFSLPNLYEYAGFTVHTLDMFYRCEVSDLAPLTAMDDVADTLWVPLHQVNPTLFGLTSIRAGLQRFLSENPLTS